MAKRAKKAKKILSPIKAAPPGPVVPLDEALLLDVAAIEKRWRIPLAQLRRWIVLGRISAVRVAVTRGGIVGSDFRFRLGDVLGAIERSMEEQSAGEMRRRDVMMG